MSKKRQNGCNRSFQSSLSTINESRRQCGKSMPSLCDLNQQQRFGPPERAGCWPESGTGIDRPCRRGIVAGRNRWRATLNKSQSVDNVCENSPKQLYLLNNGFVKEKYYRRNKMLHDCKGE